MAAMAQSDDRLRLFTAPGAWSGGFYTLAMEFAPGSGDVEVALKFLWEHPSLQGCYQRRDAEPADQPRVAPDPDHEGHLYGVASLSSSSTVPCGSFLWCYGRNPDWLEFYIPVGSLGRAYPVGAFPFEYDKNFSWQHQLDEWFADIARYVYQRNTFRMAVIGFEPLVTELSAYSLYENVPERRFESYLLPGDEGLEWYPVNAGPLMKFD